MRNSRKNNRITILMRIIFFAFIVVVVRLFFLQIIDGKKYQLLANKEQKKQYELPAKRGLIYAMDGKNPVKLVMNETVYTVFADPQLIKEDKKFEIILILREIAGGNLVRDFDKLIDKKQTRYQVLGTKLSRKQAESIKTKKFSGIGFKQFSQRVYPEGQLASQLLGFVNSEGGNYGIEGSFNEELKGKNGSIKTTTDIYGTPLIIGKDDVAIPAQDGKNIVLSIDRNIQAQVERVLTRQLQEKGIKKGSVLVLNPEDGKVMAMANYPTYSPAEFNKVTNASLFNNQTVTMPYENGSVIKAFTMAAGIDRGVISANSTFYNTDSVRVDDITIKNAFKGKTGNITMQTAMDYSLNTGMVEVARRLGGGRINLESRKIIYEYFYEKFGLGQPTGIEIAESKGVIIPPGSTGQGNAVRYSNMSFGQGMDTTMIQTATGFASIINGGTLFNPSLIAGEINNKSEFVVKPPRIRRQGSVSQSTSQQIRDILVNTRKNNAAKADLPGYRIGGKTGTSQTIINGKYVDNQTIGSYLGFGGNSTPKFVIMVSVSGEGQNLQGHRDAAPIFTEISNWLLNYLKIKPEKG